MIRFAVTLALIGSAIIGCSRATSIPAGAQVIHVAVSESTVRLDPATARAGDVYLELDEPETGSIVLVERQRTAGESPGPLQGDDLARLARGDTAGFSITGLDAGGCSAEQDAEDRGRLGPCGNVLKVVLAVGTYAIVGGMPEGDPSTGSLPPLAVLEVVP